MHSHMVTSYRFFWGPYRFTWFGALSQHNWTLLSTPILTASHMVTKYSCFCFQPHNRLMLFLYTISYVLSDPLKQSNAVVHHYFCIQIYRFLSFRRLLSQQVTAATAAKARVDTGGS